MLYTPWGTGWNGKNLAPLVCFSISGPDGEEEARVRIRAHLIIAVKRGSILTGTEGNHILARAHARPIPG